MILTWFLQQNILFTNPSACIFLLFFDLEENLHSNLSRFAIIIWLFVVLVLTSSYTASFTSMLTVEQLKATSTDVQELIRRGVYVGYTSNIVANELQRIGFDELKLKRFARHEYAIALTQGSENGGVVAIFDELPYAQVFKSNHCGDEYTMIAVKPSLLYTTGAGGFGFVRFIMIFFLRQQEKISTHISRLTYLINLHNMSVI